MSLADLDGYIGDWIETNASNQPPGGDPRSQGDDHLRGIKGVVKRTFPNFAGAAVNPTEDELNTLDGINTGASVESRLAALEAGDAKFPGGNTTFIAFWQAAAPAGWTQQTDTETPGLDNSMLRVVQTAGGGIGGSDNPISMAASDVPAHNHSASVTGSGLHDHPIYRPGAGQNRNFIDLEFVTGEVATTEQISDIDNYLVVNQRGSHSHGATVNNNTGPANWEPKYVDMIIASKV